MSIEHDIAAAQNQRDALIILGRALDRIEEKLDTQALEADLTATMGQADPWNEWTPTREEILDAQAMDLEPSEMHGIRPVDRAQRIQFLEGQLATATDPEDVRALEAKLRLAKDDGKALDLSVSAGARADITSDGTTGEVVVPPVSEERKDARAMWAYGIKLWEYIPMEATAACEAFAKGGPMWLYLANRDAVMQMPYDARQWLVADIELDSPAEAQEVGRDILKSTQSVDKAITVQAIDAISASRGA